MPRTGSTVDDARAAYARRDWHAACAGFAAAEGEHALGGDDLEAWSRAAWWLSDVVRATVIGERAARAYRDEGSATDHARTALRLGLLRSSAGDVRLGAAWTQRARALLEFHEPTALDAYLVYLEASMGFTAASDPASLEPEPRWEPAMAARLASLAALTGDGGVEALAAMVAGMAELAEGRTAQGLARLDQALLAVLAGELDPEWAGDVMCTAIHASHELADFTRMAEWTRATEEWCRPYGSDAVYAGVCRVHRLELRSAAGDPKGVERALVRECEALEEASPWVAGMGWCQAGELRRWRGDWAGARQAYARARGCGISPVPGEALLELDLDHPGRAWSILREHLDSSGRRPAVRVLRAGVEIALAAGHAAEARDLCARLRAAADSAATPGLGAWATQAEGMIALADGHAERAATLLRGAADGLRLPGQRCERARALAWWAAALDAAGDGEAAARARQESRADFERVGALPRLEVALGSSSEGPLTAREAEVLALVATGATNREVASRLVISDKTVGRHLANIYLKLDVASRTAAAAWWLARQP